MDISIKFYKHLYGKRLGEERVDSIMSDLHNFHVLCFHNFPNSPEILNQQITNQYLNN